MAKIVASASLAVVAVANEGPCDIFGAGNTPCVAAHSTVRALYGGFEGSLYQVLRASDKATKDIPTTTKGGYANSAVQDDFCSGTDCTINRIYDQSPQGNHLDTAPPGGICGHADTGVNATAEKLIVGGHPVYAAKFYGGNGYRNDKTSGIATGDDAETMYMVTSGKHYNNKCCFDYGNAEVDNLDDGAGTMEAIYFGNANAGGDGPGPWIMADMENGLFGGADKVDSHEPTITHDFVTAMVKGDASVPEIGDYTEGVDYSGHDIDPCGSKGCVLDKGSTHLECESKCNATSHCVGYVFADESCSGQEGPICWTKGAMGGSGAPRSCRNSRNMKSDRPGHWAIKGGDAQSGELQVYWDGRRAQRYAPMRKQGAIILGIGGDNSCHAEGVFYEGVMTQGYSTDAADAAVQANIVAAGYTALTELQPVTV